MDVDQFIWSTGVTMDRPIHLGKGEAGWAKGILDHCEYDRWFALLEVNGSEIGVIMHSSIRECTDCYIPCLADFLGKIQDVALSEYTSGGDGESVAEILLWEARNAFTREQFCDLMGVDFTKRVNSFEF